MIVYLLLFQLFVALVVWCNAELQYFASQLIKHYLTKGTQLETVAKIVEGIRRPCAKVSCSSQKMLILYNPFYICLAKC